MFFWKKRKLSAGEVLERTYKNFADKSYCTVVFSNPALSMIAAGIEHHRSIYGYMKYNNADLVEIGSELWSLGLGKSCGDSPAEPYESDIKAVNLKELSNVDPDSEDSELQICHLMGKMDFVNSLVHAMKNGELKLVGKSALVPYKNPFGERMLDYLKSRLPEKYQIGPRKMGDRHNLLATIRPRENSEKLTYDHNFVDILSEAIKTVLSVDYPPII